MARSKAFAELRQPLKGTSELCPDLTSTTGPISIFNPTRQHLTHKASRASGRDHGDDEELGGPGSTARNEGVVLDEPDKEQTVDSVDFKWTSRNNRKGRHEIDITPVPEDGPVTGSYIVPESTSSPREVLKNIRRMFTHYPVYDISWLVAYVFTWGSVVWCINAFFVWLPLEAPSTEFPNEITSGGGISAFIGATIFEIGSVLLMLEAVNENRAGCFGWAIELLFDDTEQSQHKGALLRFIPDHRACTHHHLNRGNLVGKSAPPDSDSDEDYAAQEGRAREWIWFPSGHDLRTHYLHEIGFLACSAQMFGATIFWISGFTALPGIYNHLSPRLVTGIYWVPQIIGGSGFIVSGILFMIETQERWWKPAPGTLGWHLGFWNTIGGLGFTLCPAFGLKSASWAQYQAGLSTFWASWAFLIASLFQLYESLQKHPVEVVKRKDAKKE